MYRFAVRANTVCGDTIAIVGSIPELGEWNAAKALRLTTNAQLYPIWSTASEVDLRKSEVKRIEYKYVKIDGVGSVHWEAQGNNRWVPVEDEVITVDDGAFGFVQAWPYSFPTVDPGRISSGPAKEGGKKIVVIGSSVALGCSSWLRQGWAWHLGQALSKQFGHELVNVAECGSNVKRAIERFPNVVVPEKPDFVIVGLSLGNEGLSSCPPFQRHAVQKTFEAGIHELVKMIKNIGAQPVLGGVYPHGDYKAEQYAIVKQTEKNLLKYGVPVLDWLPVLDDGTGKWKAGLWFDAAHPNSLGHIAMFESIDLAIFQNTPSTSSQVDSPAGSVAVTTSTDKPLYSDEAGFQSFACGWAQCLRLVNTSEKPYSINPQWTAFQTALKTATNPPLPSGRYLAFSADGQNVSAIALAEDGTIETAFELAPNTDLTYYSVLTLFAPSKGEVIFHDGFLGVFKTPEGTIRVVNSSEKEYNMHPMWYDLQAALKVMPAGAYEDVANPDTPFRTILIGHDGLLSRVKAPANSVLEFKWRCNLSDIHRIAIVPLGDRCSVRMLLYKMEYDGPCYPFDLTRAMKLSDVTDIVNTNFYDMWNDGYLTYSHDDGRIFHSKWTGLSFAHEVDEGDDPVNNIYPVFQRMRTRYSQRADRFKYATLKADEVFYIRTGSASRGEVEDCVSKLKGKRGEGRPFKLILISNQSSGEFAGIDHVMHFGHDLNPDRMNEDPQYWAHCTALLKDILNKSGLTSKNLFWCPPKPKFDEFAKPAPAPAVKETQRAQQEKVAMNGKEDFVSKGSKESLRAGEAQVVAERTGVTSVEGVVVEQDPSVKHIEAKQTHDVSVGGADGQQGQGQATEGRGSALQELKEDAEKVDARMEAAVHVLVDGVRSIETKLSHADLMFMGRIGKESPAPAANARNSAKKAAEPLAKQVAS